jgi:diguanylate cyclase (GGDEF)-like protein
MSPSSRALRPFLHAVSLAGAVAFGAHLLLALRQPGLPHPDEFVVLALLLVACEQYPITIQRRSGDDTVNLSGVFACALVLQWPTGWAIAVQVAASLVYDVRNRREWWKATFNAGQYAVALSAAAAVAQLLRSGSDGPSNGQQVAGALVACLVFFAVNNVLTGTAFALACGERLLPFLRADLVFQASVNGAMTTVAPVVLAAGDRSPWLVPLLLVPAAAVYRGAQVALEKEHRVRHDHLTDLPNRLYFAEHVGDALAERADSALQTAVLVMDLDSFKDLNDTLGHQAGDALLRQIGPRLLPVLPEGAVLARLGGDEFGVLLPVVQHDYEVVECALDLLAALAAPFEVEGTGLDVRASIGLAVAPEHGHGPEQLIQNADIAMYVAKRNRSGVETYSDEGNHHSRRRLTLLNELGPALGRDQLRLRYQPKADMQDGTPRGVEALIRWQHPSLGDVSPGEFIPLAESTGLIRMLTDFIIDEAIGQLSAWRAQGLHTRLSINLSAAVLHEGADVVERILDGLAAADVPPSALMVELTETALMADPEGTTRALQELTDAGVLLSIDDFGTGHSALSYLARLPVAELKIDRSFVTHIESNEANGHIVGSVVDLARKLGITVVAEGIERMAEWQTLAGLGCHVAQGFLIGRALPPEEILAAFAPGRPLVDTFAATFGMSTGTAVA